MIEFRMPSLGADMEAGTLVEWQMKPGDRVKKGQIVAVVETQKGAIDIEIFDEGVVDELLVEVGKEVPVGTVLARLHGDHETAEPVAVPPPVSTPSSSAPTEPTPSSSAPTEPTPPGLELSPRARKRAQELGLDPSLLAGLDRPITAEDVERIASERGQPQTGMRSAIAAAMTRSKREIPHYYLWHAIDLEPMLLWLERENESRRVADRVLPIAPLLRAVALALREFPELAGGATQMHVGLAVSLRDGGLVNPAIHDADLGGLAELMAKIRDVTQRARSGGLRASELADAVITVTSLGDRGVDGVLGVIHPPQSAIVGFGTIAARAWVVDGTIAVRRVVEIGLSADHRVSDGHRGAAFLRAIERRLHEPAAL